HTEEMKAYKGRNTGKSAVCPLIGMQIIGFQRVRESECLVEAEAYAVASDRVHSTRGITNKSHVVTIDALEAMHNRDSSSFATGRHSFLQASAQFRKGGKDVRDASRRAGRDTSETDFGIADWRDVNLSIVFPIDVDTVGPWTQTIVLPKSVAPQIKRAR